MVASGDRDVDSVTDGDIDTGASALTEAVGLAVVVVVVDEVREGAGLEPSEGVIEGVAGADRETEWLAAGAGVDGADADAGWRDEDAGGAALVEGDGEDAGGTALVEGDGEGTGRDDCDGDDTISVSVVRTL